MPAQPVKKKYSENQKVGTCKTLSYKPLNKKDGKIYVNIVEDDLKEQTLYWKNALIGFVVGDTSYQKPTETFIANIWDFVDTPQILGHESRYYVFWFNSSEDRDKVLLNEPYAFHNKPFIVQPWEIDFKFDPNYITTIPLWITLPRLPVGYWSSEALSKIASGIIRPLHTDHYTASMEYIFYARLCVEMDASKPLISSVEMLTTIGIFHHSIEYD